MVLSLTTDYTYVLISKAKLALFQQKKKYIICNVRLNSYVCDYVVNLREKTIHQGFDPCAGGLYKCITIRHNEYPNPRQLKEHTKNCSGWATNFRRATQYNTVRQPP